MSNVKSQMSNVKHQKPKVKSQKFKEKSSKSNGKYQIKNAKSQMTRYMSGQIGNSCEISVYLVRFLPCCIIIRVSRLGKIRLGKE